MTSKTLDTDVLLHGLSPQEYLEKSLKFIVQYKWLHDFKLIRFLVDDISDHLPVEWSDAFSQLSDVELQKQLDLWTGGTDEVYFTIPESLQSFLQDTRSLSIDRKIRSAPFLDVDSEVRLHESAEVKIPPNLLYGMGPKKQHEVSRMAHVVDQLCRKHGIRAIVDLGAGMGYLDCVLSEVLSYKVIAIESNNVRSLNAKERAVRHSRRKRDIIKDAGQLLHETLRIDGSPECIDSLRSMLTSHGVADSRLCFVGLHCCGDFTPMFLRTFAALECAVAFLCVGCCYHLMQADDRCLGVRFCPISAIGRGIQSSLWTQPERLLTVSSLRLASQETKVKWIKDLDAHVRGHFFRAVLECVVADMQLEIRRQRRHTSTFQDESFEKYLDGLNQNFNIKGCDNLEVLHEKLWKKYHSSLKLLPKLRVFRVLQGLIQSVLESFIAVDRWLCLRDDLNFADVDVIPIFDETLSPRNLALLGSKNAPS